MNFLSALFNKICFFFYERKCKRTLTMLLHDDIDRILLMIGMI